jgi:hypothetical protein
MIIATKTVEMFQLTSGLTSMASDGNTPKMHDVWGIKCRYDLVCP